MSIALIKMVIYWLPTYLVFWEQLVLCTVLRRRKNHFKNKNSCFFFKSQKALVCKPLFFHVSNALSQQPLSLWQKCYSLNLLEARTLIWCHNAIAGLCRSRNVQIHMEILAQGGSHCNPYKDKSDCNDCQHGYSQHKWMEFPN